MHPIRLPAALPVFPLTGTVLLPGNFLPLNVFEARYRQLVEDVAAGGGVIGMIQPLVPMPDNWGPVVGASARPELYRVGCAGVLTECERQPDGRYVIVLRGASRFRVRRERDSGRTYRVLEVDFSEFRDDLRERGAAVEPVRLLAAVEAMSDDWGLEFDLDLLRSLPGVALLNALCAALPLSPAEKQALLEAPGVEERYELLLDLMGMGPGMPLGVERFKPPTVH